MRIKSNLDTIIYEKILDSIISGDYQMGDKIVIGDLADKYEVSRTPVVQAVKLLVNENVLESQSNGRAEVPQYEAEDIQDICDARLLIEQYVVKEIMADQKKRANVYEQLCKCQERCLSCLKKKQYLDFSKADLKFHRVLVSGAGNKVLTDIYAKIQGRFTVANYLVLPLMNRDFNETTKDHDMFLQALKDEDLDGALSYMEKHITKISKLIKEKESF